MIPHSKPTIGQKDQIAITSLLNSLQLSQGIAAKKFTDKLTDYTNAKGGVLTGSGSEAQMALLLALGIGEGDEVIIPTYVCKSVYEAIVAVKATPILCDIGSNWLMTYETVSPCVTSKTAAVILVHIFGFDAWDDRFLSMGIPIIEDFCQAFGLHANRSTQQQGIASFYSFQATKCLTTGEGGFAVTHDQGLFDNLQNITNKGLIKTRFTDIQAVLGLSQLDQYSFFLDRRRQIAERYLKQLSPVCISEELKKLIPKSVLFRFPLRLSPEQISEFVPFMAKKQIAVRKGVDTMLHKEYGSEGNTLFTTAEHVYEQTICLPIYPSLTDEEQGVIIDEVNYFLSKEKYESER